MLMMMLSLAPEAEEAQALFRRSLSCLLSIPHDVPEHGYHDDDDDEHGDGDDEHGFDDDDDDDHHHHHCHYLQWQGPSMRRWSW